MKLKTDEEGIVTNAKIKVSTKHSDWYKRMNIQDCERMFVCTYSFSDMFFIRRILSKVNCDITLIANTKYYNTASKIKTEFPLVKMFLSPNAHAKILLAEPDIVWVSTDNFGHIPDSYDAAVGICNKDVYNHFYKQIKHILIQPSTMELK